MDYVMGKNTDELTMLKEEVKNLPADFESRAAWQALTYVLTSIKDSMDEIKKNISRIEAAAWVFVVAILVWVITQLLEGIH